MSVLPAEIDAVPPSEESVPAPETALPAIIVSEAVEPEDKFEESRPVALAPEWIGSMFSARLMAGLQTGVIAGLMTTAWFIFEAWRTGRPLWAVLNMISTVILGRSGYVYAFGIATIVGISIHLLVSALYGIIFSMLVSPRARPFFAANIGLLYSFAGFAFTFIWILPRFAPIMFRNAPRLEWAGAHFLGGMVLGLYPDMARSLLRRPLPVAVTTPEPVVETEVAPAAPDGLGSAIGDVRS